MRWLAVLLLFPLLVQAHSHEQGDIQIRHPWSRATAPGAKVAAGYMELRNSGAQPDRLLSVETPVAKRVEMHITRRDGEVMRMRQVQSFEVPARERYEMRPGGSHLMLVDIVRPLKKGERFPMKLRFEKAGEMEVQVEVQDLGARHGHH
ncbi:MAG TPA: copper chaperone PCu(A)C [Burkholderiales bacterium]|nr:copper chaperone PCu(A)C [Burkholderiales bacterium]